MTVYWALAALPSLLLARWMWKCWFDTSDRAPVSHKWLAEDNRRRDALGAEGVCWNWSALTKRDK